MAESGSAARAQAQGPLGGEGAAGPPPGEAGGAETRGLLSCARGDCSPRAES